MRLFPPNLVPCSTRPQKGNLIILLLTRHLHVKWGLDIHMVCKKHKEQKNSRCFASGWLVFFPRRSLLRLLFTQNRIFKLLLKGAIGYFQ